MIGNTSFEFECPQAIASLILSGLSRGKEFHFGSYKHRILSASMFRRVSGAVIIRLDCEYDPEEKPA